MIKTSNLGDVVIDGDDIHGDGVNVAALENALEDPTVRSRAEEALKRITGE